MTSKIFFFKKSIVLTVAALALATSGMAQKKKMSGNPIFPGWYADPEAVVYNGEYWVFPTYSAPFDEQTFLDAFSSPDLVNWTKHPRVLDNSNVKWVRRAMWAPAVIHANNKYYLFFGGNDVHQGEVGGIGVLWPIGQKVRTKMRWANRSSTKLLMGHNLLISLSLRTMMDSITCTMAAGDTAIW